MLNNITYTIIVYVFNFRPNQTRRERRICSKMFTTLTDSNEKSVAFGIQIKVSAIRCKSVTYKVAGLKPNSGVRFYQYSYPLT